ncbi:MAG TPA: hypothetical protein VE988_03050 [Gemmataceae bacterium]|nr:hypothetical protein [Gemmataceae bacterium]
MRWTMTLVLLTIPAFANAQDTFTLKMPPQAKGDVHRVSIDMRDSTRVLRIDMFGNEFKRHITSAASLLSYADECLAVDNGTVTSFRRHIESAAQIVNEGDPIFLAVHGKTVRVDQQNGTRQLTWEDAPARPDTFTEQLEQELKDGKDKKAAIASFDPLPGQAVKVGESWNIDVSAIVKDCEAKHGCKLTGATGTGTLKEVYQGAKGQCAKVEVHIKVPLTTLKAGETVIELKDDSGTSLDGIYDFALTAGDSHYQSVMRLNFQAVGTTAERDGTSARLQIETAVELKEQRVGQR